MFSQRINFITFLLFAAAFHIAGFVYLYLYTELIPPKESPSREEEITLTLEIQSPVESKTKEKKKMRKEGEGRSKKDGESFSEQFKIDKKKWGGLLERLEKSDSLDNYRVTYEDLFPNINGQWRFGESYIYRKRHNHDLTVKDVFPTLNTIEKPFSEQIKKSPKVLRDYNKRNEIIEKYRKWKKGDIATDRMEVQIVKYSKSKSNIPLKFPPEERQKYFDETIKYSKEKQLEMFYEKFMGYHPDKGDLPVAVRELYTENLQRILQPFSYDPTYMQLDYFEEALNKEDFLKHSMYQVSRLNGTRTATELLFSIENIYEIQQNAWKYLYEFAEIYESLPEEKKQTRRVETLRRIYERYKPLAEKKKIKSADDAVEIYSNKRLEIIDYLIENTPEGYRLFDARFQRAKILWTKGYLLEDMKYIDQAVREFWALANDTGLLDQGENSQAESEKDKDFLHKKALATLVPYLLYYLDGGEDKNRVIQVLHELIINSERERMQKKMMREKELLWP